MCHYIHLHRSFIYGAKCNLHAQVCGASSEALIENTLIHGCVRGFLVRDGGLLTANQCQLVRCGRSRMDAAAAVVCALPHVHRSCIRVSVLVEDLVPSVYDCMRAMTTHLWVNGKVMRHMACVCVCV
jgi:hypothetical protein